MNHRYLLFKDKQIFRPILVLNRAKFFNQIIIDPDSSQIFNIIQLNDTLFIGTGIINGGKFIVIDSKNRETNQIFNYPYDNSHPDISFEMLGMAYQSLLITNPKQKKFVSADMSCGLIEFIELKDNRFFKTNEYLSYLPLYTEEKDDVGGFGARLMHKNRNGFIDLKSTDKFVFALYSGKTFLDYQIKSFTGNEILVFDWDGNPIERLTIDNDLTCFAIDEMTNRIFGICNNPDPEIKIYDLPQSLK